jgi:hypothetical protein
LILQVFQPNLLGNGIYYLSPTPDAGSILSRQPESLLR